MAEVYLRDTDLTLWHGDVLDALRQMGSESVDMVCTSPPYWGLRDYGTGSWEGGDPDCEHIVGGQVQDSKAPGAITAGVRPGVDASRCLQCGAHRIDQQLGLEATPEEYVEKMVEVFREVRRVLAPHGTVWLNLGDSYSADHAQKRSSVDELGRSLNTGIHAKVPGSKAGELRGTPPGLKAKDLVGIPWMVAFALRSDGWYLRSDIIWAKPNPMPESIRDRPTKSHEYIFLLSKSKSYYFDQEAVREPAEWSRWGAQTNDKYEGTQSSAGWIKPKSKAELLNAHRSSYPSANTGGNSLEGHVSKSDQGLPVNPAGRNIRSVWTITTQPYADAHFAVFPEELPRRAILAGCPEQVCRECGKPRLRIVEKEIAPPEIREKDTTTFEATGTQDFRYHNFSGQRYQDWLDAHPAETVGWTDCGHDDYRPGVVLDIFGGSGTTALVARKLARHSVLIELNSDYCALIANRLQQLSLFA